ncbi:MAG TPA: hypothetical protein VEZ26_06095 [Sphingomonadaceae bacterium]|nr:hypothetical protein [Sphingomonadaceae bacterium]
MHRRISVAEPEERLAVLLRLFPETAEGDRLRPVLIPTSDQDVQLVLDHAEELSRHYTMQGSYRDGTAARVLSKDSFYELCSAQGVTYPAVWKSSRENLLGLLPDIHFPCIIKPTRIHEIKHEMRGHKVWIAQDAEGFRREAERIPASAGTLLVQQMIPGPESAITLCCLHMDRRGLPRHVFTARKLRQYPPGFGSASLVESAPEPETARISRELLSSIGYSGIAALEFKHHPETGKLNLIEVNVRPSLWFALSEAAGRPTVLSAFWELAGRDDAVQERSQVQGVRWRYFSKDLASTLFYRTHSDFVLPPPEIPKRGGVSGKVDAVFALRDPIPVIGELLNIATKFVSRTAATGSAFRKWMRI